MILLGLCLIAIGIIGIYYCSDSNWKLTAAFIIFVVVFIYGGINVDAHEYDPADIVLIGKVVQHEAGNQSDLGKRLVCDTILNRVESENFPNTVYDVIMQPGQYCNPSKFPPKEIYSLVAEEIYMRTNPQVLWYRTKRYHKYGVPLLVEGNHYFSGR